MPLTIASQLNSSAQKFRKELLLIAILGLGKSLPYFNLRTGIQYKETVGTLDGAFELQSYTGKKDSTDDLAITGRELETFLGSCVKEFDPHALIKTIYSDAAINGKSIEDATINKAVVALMMKKLSGGLNKSLFSAVRSATGKETSQLFNGFDTITGKEITANAISTEKGNLYEYATVIDSTNAVDILKEINRRASDELQDEKRNMYVPVSVYNAYCDDYKATTGAVAYNKEFKQTFLEGSDDMCTIVPLIGKKGSPYIHMSPKENMLIGCSQMSDLENIEIRRGDNPFALQFVAKMFFGTEFESINSDKLLVAKKTA